MILTEVSQWTSVGQTVGQSLKYASPETSVGQTLKYAAAETSVDQNVRQNLVK